MSFLRIATDLQIIELNSLRENGSFRGQTLQCTVCPSRNPSPDSTSTTLKSLGVSPDRIGSPSNTHSCGGNLDSTQISFGNNEYFLFGSPLP